MTDLTEVAGQVYLVEVLTDLIPEEQEGRAGWVERGEDADQFLEEERAGLGEGDVRDLTDQTQS